MNYAIEATKTYNHLRAIFLKVLLDLKTYYPCFDALKCKNYQERGELDHIFNFNTGFSDLKNSFGILPLEVA